MDEDVTQFMAITGTDNEAVAKGYLEISGGDPMQAIQLFFENPELQSSFANQPGAAAHASASSDSHAPPATSNIGHEDAHGVIHIDSDDDDVPMTQPGDDNHIVIPDDDDREDIAAVARAAQEEEDAAMARRLQDDMYSQDPNAMDGVRAPMARTTETLVGPDSSWGMEDEHDAAILDQLRRRRQPQGAAGLPFTRSVWDDPEAPPVPMASRPGGPPESQTRQQRLADLYRPPYDLVSHFSWDDAREEGKEGKKWILVNVQDMSDFQCQTLNRDHWKNEAIKALVKEHFIFLQYDKSSAQAREFITFYFAEGYENSDNYPYVTIIDPRTGEQVKIWSGMPFPTPTELYADLVEFLDRYSLESNSKNPVPKTKPKTKPVDYGRMTEEEMLEMALRNSLEGSNGGSSRPSVQDPDELTRHTADIGKGKGKAVEEVSSTHESEAPEAAGSPFAQISSSNPHTEPAMDPANVTRIQFRHPTGRTIRRFAVNDLVRRIYEWLKAEPLEDKQGVPFELKAVPGGDLIDKLGITIGDAGLKNGTVMIEFIEGDS